MSHFDEKDLLTKELRERSADIGGHPIGLDDVRRSARKIRRRRAAITGTVAAVVASITVPAGLGVITAQDPVDGPAEQPTVAGSPDANAPSTPAPTPRTDGSYVLTTKGLHRGPAPQVSYVLQDGRRLVNPEGSIELPAAYAQIAPVRNGWLAIHGGENGYEIVTLNADMEVEETAPGGPSFMLNEDGTRILYSEREYDVPGGTIVVDAPTESDDQREEVTWSAPRNSNVVPVGYLGEDAVVYQTEGEQPQVFLAGEGEPVELSRFLHAEDASEANGLVAGMTSSSSNGGCYGVMDPAVSTTQLVWRTCDYSLGEFSPDGRFVIAGAAYFDAWGSPSIVVLDARTGDPVVKFAPGKDVAMGVAQATWEDQDTLLASVVEGDELTMVRAELSGELEAATDAHDTQNMSLPLWFADRPR